MHVISQKKSQHRLLCDRNARFWVQNREFAVSGVHLRRNIMWLCVVWAIWLMPCAQTHAQAESPHEGIEGLNGSAYFDFAFRDTPNIVASGHIEGALAQAESELDGDSTDDGQSSGTGLMGEKSVDDQKKSIVRSTSSEAHFRVSDLILHCTNAFCESPENVEALLRSTGLTLGHETTKTDLAISIERLRKTGFFSKITQDLSFDGSRVAVAFNTEPHTFVRRIEIDNSGALYPSEIKKKMMIRVGGALYPRTALLKGKNPDAMEKSELIAMALEDQADSLRRLYVKEGYFDAKVDIGIEEVETNRVDLHVNVSNADGYVLGKIYVRGHKVRSYSEIESLFRSYFSYFGYVKKTDIEDAVQEFIANYREAGYYQAKLDYVSRRVKENRSIDIFLDLHEGDKWAVEFDGNESLSAKELSEALTFQSSGYVDQGELAASIEAIKATYVSAGYYYVKVTGEILRHGAGDAHSILFHIEEGQRVEIGQIEFDGASVFSHSELLDEISSHEYSALGSGAYPQRAMIADDAAKIVDAYRKRGYLNADVVGWNLATTDQVGRLKLTFIIREGEVSHFAHRLLRYTDRETYDDFDVLIDKPENDVFSDYTFRAERAAITKQLRLRGHATVSSQSTCTSYTSDGAVASESTCDVADFAAACMPDDIEALCQIVETRSGTMERCKRHYDTEYGIEGEPECKPKNGITGTQVDVTYDVTLGPRFVFGDAFIHGNVVTRQWVVEQDIPFKAGEIFDINRIIDARGLLRRRTIYRTASLNAIGVDDGLVQSSESGDSTSLGERSVPLTVNIEEGDRRWFDFAIGVSLTGGDWVLAGEMEYVEANLLGTGWELRFLIMPEARFFNASNEFVFTQRFNQNFFTLLTLSIPIVPAQGINLVSQLFYDLRYIPDTNKEEAGWLLELQWNVNKALFTALAFELESSNASSFGVDVSDSLSDYNACYPVTFFMKCPFASKKQDFTVSLTPRVSYDGRDSPIAPKNGFYTEAKVKLAYSNANGLYAMPEFRVSYLVTFLKYFTTAFNLRWGLGFHKSDATIPLIDRYFLGGLNMRGYDNDALGPRLYDPSKPGIATNEAAGGETMFNFTAELRYPIWNNIGLYGAVFVDMGALTQSLPTDGTARDYFRELFVEEMRYTAGLGLRWQFSESIPPIVVDYGFIINRRRGDPVGNFSLNIGYSF